jgi:hypothetical protein
MENKDKELLRSEEAGKIVKEINEKYNMDKVTEMIKDNFISFTYKDKAYRVRLLNEKEKDELDLIRRKKFGELLQDNNILFEKEIIKLYKARGIDIDELDTQIKRLQSEIKSEQKKLGEALENKEPDNILKAFKENIINLTNEMYAIAVQKTDLLENSFEKRLIYQVNYASAWMSLEEKIDDNYKRAFDKLDDFMNCEKDLMDSAVFYMMTITNRL